MATSGTISSATVDAPARPVGRGGWVYLPEDFARQHPFYGPYGWAWLLLLFLFVGPVVLGLQDFRIALGVAPRPDLFWIVVAAELAFGVLCWIAGLKLGRERSDFPPFFYLTAAVGIVCALLFFYVLLEGLPRDYEDRALFGFLWRAVPIIVWTVYVRRSKRINVTTLKRVTSRDPFLRSQWLSDETPAGGVSQARRRSLFARPFRKISVVATRPPGDIPTPGSTERVAVREPVPELTPRRAEETRYEPAEPVAEAPPPPPPPRPVLRRPTAPAAERHYVARRVASAAVPAETISTRPADAHAPDPGRRQRMESALVLDRLRRLQIAYDEGLITADELRGKRAELLREL